MSELRLHESIERLVGTPVATIRPSDSLREAAATLAADGVGLLVVVDRRGIVGVLSERDLVLAVAEDASLEVERVRDYCSTDLVEVEDSARLVDAARAMVDADVRHLAVTRDGVVIGVLSMRDVVRTLVAGTASAASA